MAVQYTYEDFENAAKNAGLLGQFSQADLTTAQSDPNFGMSILNLKQNWANAGTNEEKQAINQQANDLRASYGNYTGGADGSQYISTGKLNNDIDTALDKLNSYGSFSYADAPTYNNQYSAQQTELLNQILNQKEFEWSKETDPLWSSYKKSYLREGDRATANALAQAAAASGGIPSSYAVNAATQAGDYYATQLNDKIPDLRAQAYDEYLNEYQRQLSNLDAVNNQEQLEYQKYLNDLSQYNTDRNFAYTDYQTQYNMLQNALSNLQNQQQIEYDQNYQTTAYQDALKQYQDSLKQQEIENAMNAAQIFGYVPESYGDILGVSAGTQTADQAYREYQMAQQAAKAASGTSGSSGSSGSSGGSEGTMTLTTAKQAASNGVFNDQVLKVLRENGYTDDMLEAIYGYVPTAATGASSGSSAPGYNSAYFKAAMNNLSSQLAQGKAQNAVSGIDSFWGKLSEAQKQEVQALLNKYGYSYS